MKDKEILDKEVLDFLKEVVKIYGGKMKLSELDEKFKSGEIRVELENSKSD